MDVFCEQIIPIKKSVKEAVLLFLIWILAGGLAVLAFLLLGISMLGIIAAALIVYGTYRLSQTFFIEFEYIVTNNLLDIDKIIAKSSRKRMVSIEISGISEIKKYKYSKNTTAQKTGERVLLACNPEDENAYEMTVKSDGEILKIIMAPNRKIQEGIKKSLPKYISNSAFRGE